MRNAVAAGASVLRSGSGGRERDRESVIGQGAERWHGGFRETPWLARRAAIQKMPKEERY
jgi:hypothetical protein